MILLDRAGRRLARWLNTPRHAESRAATTKPGRLARTLRPGDVLLVEGSSRISAAIKYLTQSSWSHAVLCIAPPVPHAGPGEEPSVLLEAVPEGLHGLLKGLDVQRGVGHVCGRSGRRLLGDDHRVP